jgi:hypothetical protein
MSFPRYPKYKASGVEWLGDAPPVAGTLRVPSAEAPPPSTTAKRCSKRGYAPNRVTAHGVCLLHGDDRV